MDAVTPARWERLLPGLAVLRRDDRGWVWAVGIAQVGHSDNVLTVRAFAARHRQRVDAGQEMLALGA